MNEIHTFEHSFKNYFYEMFLNTDKILLKNKFNKLTSDHF